jgi:hypothetical protein
MPYCPEASDSLARSGSLTGVIRSFAAKRRFRPLEQGARQGIRRDRRSDGGGDGSVDRASAPTLGRRLGRLIRGGVEVDGHGDRDRQLEGGQLRSYRVGEPVAVLVDMTNRRHSCSTLARDRRCCDAPAWPQLSGACFTFSSETRRLQLVGGPRLMPSLRPIRAEPI